LRRAEELREERLKMASRTVVQINTTLEGSTGSIMSAINAALPPGFSGYRAYGSGREPARLPAGNPAGNPGLIWIGGKPALRWGLYGTGYWSRSVQLHLFRSLLLDRHGFGSATATRAFLYRLKELKPDLVHLHNIHGYYLHVGLLFQALRQMEVPVLWTFHDCWPFTGHCAHFEPADCLKWLEGCGSCPLRREYPTSLWADNSRRNFRDKQRLFCSLPPGQLHLTAPSLWMKAQLERSFLSRYPIHLVPNGITEPGQNRESRRDTAARFSLPEDRKLLLFVTDGINILKGDRHMRRIAAKLPPDQHIIAVGIGENARSGLPANVSALPRIESHEDMNALYRLSDVLLNPTLADTFPLVNLEALAAGLPAAAFATGGVPELIGSDCGIVVPRGDTEALYHAAQQILSRGKEQYAGACREQAARYRLEDTLKGYMSLYLEHMQAGGRGGTHE
jgi:putative colanic acid biosynthesis glycosyltransferase